MVALRKIKGAFASHKQSHFYPDYGSFGWVVLYVSGSIGTTTRFERTIRGHMQSETEEGSVCFFSRTCKFVLAWYATCTCLKNRLWVHTNSKETWLRVVVNLIVGFSSVCVSFSWCLYKSTEVCMFLKETW